MKRENYVFTRSQDVGLFCNHNVNFRIDCNTITTYFYCYKKLQRSHTFMLILLRYKLIRYIKIVIIKLGKLAHESGRIA